VYTFSDAGSSSVYFLMATYRGVRSAEPGAVRMFSGPAPWVLPAIEVGDPGSRLVEVLQAGNQACVLDGAPALFDGLSLHYMERDLDGAGTVASQTIQCQGGFPGASAMQLVLHPL
jgi:hypothetical protein